MFKQKIIDKYAKTLDETKLKASYENFKAYQSKAEAIKGFKEEEYQDGFLRDVFEACLGYTLKTTNPNDYNLSRERKNETDGKKADGAVSIDSEVIALIELKDQNTKNLDAAKKGELSPVDQCFRYLNSHQKARYAIVSNFDELRLYVGKKTEYEKFNLFSLDFEGFKRLYLTLSLESIKSGLTTKLKEETDSFEKQISKELYRDYSLFRSGLFEDIRKNNTHIEPHKLLRLTQTLCDRIIFILFAEDRELLRKNTIKEIRERYHNDIVGLSMYEYYKIYFKAINEGNDKLGIMPYNGGLFAENAELDSLVISDACLDMQAQKLSDYDFESDISVNILGHIFEQSLTDLEELSASLNGENIDKSKSKRKKDGVFYTPEYITRYIVANTLGKLCEQKREELGISSQIEPPKNPKKLTKAEEAAKSALQEYREWLKTLKICDPACGSGAFLNQALEYLIAQHKTTAQQIIYFGDLTATEDIEKSILEHNLYGVDINEEAVEIARLSLWLRTASKGRKLTNLSEKIKCGNSLIADKGVAENAFDWQAEFADVFVHGGFDVIIGNPPYITFALGKKQEFESSDVAYLKEKFPLSSAYKVSSYLIFIEQSLKLISEQGLVSFIVPNALYTNFYYAKFREFIIDNYSIHQLLNLTYEVFEDADTGGSSIFVFGKNNTDSTKLKLIPEEKDFGLAFEFAIQQDIFKKIPDNKFLFSNSLISLWNKSFVGSISIGSDNFQFYNGIKTGDNDKFLAETKIDDRYKPIIRGRDFYKYTPLENEYFVLFDPEQLWSNTKESMYIVDEKLVFRQTSDHLVVTYDNKQNFTMDTTHIVFDKSEQFNHKYLLAILNSKLLNFLYQIIVPEIGKAFSEVKGVNLKRLPIKKISDEEQLPFIEKADLMLNLNMQLKKAQQNFLDELKLEKIPQKLQNFDELEFDEFVAEYTKAKKIKFADKLEERNFKNDWLALFENDKKAVAELKSQIARTDEEIDAMVYGLYGLSYDEIAIVEGE